jgi:CheY-like chemotaxis protein
MAFRFRRARPRADTAGRDADHELSAEIDVLERIRARYPQGTRLHFAAPTRCPRCAEYGLVDEVDLVAGRAENRCLECGCEWVVTVRALLAVEGRRRLRAAGVVTSSSLAALRNRRALEARLAPAAHLEGIRFARGAGGEVERRKVRASTRPLPPPGGTARRVAAPGAPTLGDTPGLPLRVLLVEADPDDVRVVRSLCDPAGPAVIDLRTATTRAAGEVAALASQPDLVLLDLGLPDSRGVATLTHWHERVGESPVLVVSGGSESEVVARRVELNVAGVVAKAALAHYLERGDEGASAFVQLLRSSSGISVSAGSSSR